MKAAQVSQLLQDLLCKDSRRSVDERLGDVHPVDLANALCEFSTQELWAAFNRLEHLEQAKIFRYLPISVQTDLVNKIDQSLLVPVISAMSPDNRADLFAQLSQDQQDALLPILAYAEREDILHLCSQIEGTAGSIMTSDYAVLKAELRASEALEVLRQEAPNKETIYSAYIVDKQRNLVGVISLKDLILAPTTSTLADLMNHDPISGHVSDSQEAIAHKIAKYDLLALPIINNDGQIVGIVTHDDALDIVTEEATEDFHKASNIGKMDVNVKLASPFLLFRKRVFWLVLLVFGNLFSGAGISFFETTIADNIALLFFLPLLIGSSGNAGAQTGTLMVRGLALGDINLRDWPRLLAKEVLVSGLLGLAMAIAVVGLGWWRGGIDIAMIVALTMLLVVVVGSLIGLCLPFLLSRLNLDPATASGPLITSIADVAGVVLYFSIASWFLSF